MRSNPVLVFEVVLYLEYDGGARPVSSASTISLLLQLLCGKLLIHVTLVTGHAQVLSDRCHEGHGSAILLHLSWLLLHMDLVSATQIK